MTESTRTQALPAGETKDIEVATNIISRGLSYLESLSQHDSVYRFGSLWYFDKNEYQEIVSLRDLIRSYVTESSPRKPLSIAVFGPPGSGKSHAVRAIQTELQAEAPGRLLPFFEINLTQVSSVDALQAEFRYISRATAAIGSSTPKNGGSEKPQSPVPFIFVDEFDAPRGGRPLGWLDWFLAPMNDSKIGHGEEQFSIKQAVYIFAGGTAPRLAEFSDTRSRAFVEAKGPDFVSRLHGHLDVRGPNHERMPFSRRAVVIRQSFGAGSLASKLDFTVRKEVVEGLLFQGRYKHGSRSINAVCDLIKNAAEKRGSKTIGKDHFPAENLLNLHVDQGELDPDRLGGLIGLSIGKEYQERDESRAAKSFKTIANLLWEHGATIAYGGHWNKELTKDLLDRIKERAISQAATRHRVEIFTRDDKDAPSVEQNSIIVPTFAHWSPNPGMDGYQQFESSVSAIRMRWVMSVRCAARVFVGGVISQPSGRMQGLLEELVLALALQQPIYLLGAFGDFGKVVGKLLGLASAGTNVGAQAAAKLFFKPSGAMLQNLSSHQDLFQPLPAIQLPLTAADAANFIQRYAVGSSNWPDNGLSLDENRVLFSLGQTQSEIDQGADLILRGLRRRFGS
jgi:hypothetical protein